MVKITLHTGRNIGAICVKVLKTGTNMQWEIICVRGGIAVAFYFLNKALTSSRNAINAILYNKLFFFLLEFMGLVNPIRLCV